MAADGLLEVGVNVFGSQYGAVFEPTAIVPAYGGHIVGLVVKHDDHTGVAPGGKEADGLFGGLHNVRFFGSGSHRSIGIDLYPDFVDRLIFFSFLVFREKLRKERFITLVQVSQTGVLFFATKRTKMQLTFIDCRGLETFCYEIDGKCTIVTFGQVLIFQIGFVVGVIKVVAVINHMGYGNIVLRKGIHY